MPVEKPWGAIDPNSAHQLWSRWTFKLKSPTLARQPPQTPLHVAFQRWCSSTFGSVGQAHADEWEHTHAPTGTKVAKGYILWAEVEGPPSTDPSYHVFIRKQFRLFVDLNWGRDVLFEMDVNILAGDAEDGKPPRQLVVIQFLAARTV